MRSLLYAIAAGAIVAAGESDPAGTAALQIEVGQSAPVSAAPGANLLCDDPGVVASDFAASFAASPGFFHSNSHALAPAFLPTAL